MKSTTSTIRNKTRITGQFNGASGCGCMHSPRRRDALCYALFGYRRLVITTQLNVVTLHAMDDGQRNVIRVDAA